MIEKTGWVGVTQNFPFPSASENRYSAAPPDLGRGVAPLGRFCAFAVWYSRPLPLTSDVG